MDLKYDSARYNLDVGNKESWNTPDYKDQKIETENTKTYTVKKYLLKLVIRSRKVCNICTLFVNVY